MRTFIASIYLIYFIRACKFVPQLCAEDDRNTAQMIYYRLQKNCREFTCDRNILSKILPSYKQHRKSYDNIFCGREPYSVSENVLRLGTRRAIISL